MSTEIVKGSIQSVADSRGNDIIGAILDAVHIVIVDTSGSMAERDAAYGRTRSEQAMKELLSLQEQNPGKILLVEFASEVEVRLDGRLRGDVGARTNLAGALVYIYQFVDSRTITVITDGEPDDAERALRVAYSLPPINAVYVGPEDVQSEGYLFCKRLASIHGGQAMRSGRAGSFLPEAAKILGLPPPK